jgi:hypothetical protein
MILALATALMVALHVAVASEARPSPGRRVFPSLFLSRLGGVSQRPAACRSLRADACRRRGGLAGVLARFATERRLRTYGVYEAVELAALLYLSCLTLRPLF